MARSRLPAGNYRRQTGTAVIYQSTNRYLVGRCRQTGRRRPQAHREAKAQAGRSDRIINCSHSVIIVDTQMWRASSRPFPHRPWRAQAVKILIAASCVLLLLLPLIAAALLRQHRYARKFSTYKIRWIDVDIIMLIRAAPPPAPTLLFSHHACLSSYRELRSCCRCLLLCLLCALLSLVFFVCI